MERVLVVEDDADLREAIAELLRLEGFEPVCAGSGHEALDYLGRGKRPRLILLDLMLPHMDGETFRAEQVKRADLDRIPVVIVSARSDTPERAERLALPYLTKPFDCGALVDTVKKYCKRR